MTTKELYKKILNEFTKYKKDLSEDTKLILQERQQIKNNDLKTLRLLNEIRMLTNEDIGVARKAGFEDFWKRSMEKENKLLLKKEELRRKGKMKELQEVQKEIETERQRRNYLRSRYLEDLRNQKK